METTEPRFPFGEPGHAHLPKPTVGERVVGLGVMLGPSAVVQAGAAAGVLLAARAARRMGRRQGGRWLGRLISGGSLLPWAYLGARPWLLHWGATSEEITRALPGDERVPNPTSESTRALTIGAPPEDVWPWLVQVGYGRGGWYSVDLLERWAGAGDFVEGHSAERILPALQRLQVGEVIRLSPWTGMRVAVLERPRAMVLHSLEGPSKAWGMTSWAFVLEEQGEQDTRLIVRGRTGIDPRRPAARWLGQLLELPHFWMERKMMLGLKRRAERGAAF